MSIPTDLIAFKEAFSSEEHCLDYIEKLRWPNGFRCPNCEHDVGYRLTLRRLIQCAVCRHQTSATAGTIFHKTRIPLQNWFWIIFLVAQDKGGASASRLAAQLGMYYKTVWYVLHKIRHAMERRDERITLAGYIEMDEAIVGRQARKPGRPRKNPDEKSTKCPKVRKLGQRATDPTRRKTQTEVVVMVERENAHAGNLAMKVVHKTTRDDLREVTEQRVDDDKQWFKTDALQSHYVLKSMGHTLHALKLGNTQWSVEELPVVHRAISLLKRFLMGTYHGVSPLYLQSYLHEFCFRWNRRDKQQTIYDSLLKACALALPMSYAEVKL